jgi:hypothetical protein
MAELKDGNGNRRIADESMNWDSIVLASGGDTGVPVQ